LRVGIAAIVRGFAGIGPSVVAARAGTVPCASSPAATAPPVFRKVRRSEETRVGFMADTSQTIECVRRNCSPENGNPRSTGVTRAPPISTANRRTVR
jgi:hypothetical protein